MTESQPSCFKVPKFNYHITFKWNEFDAKHLSCDWMAFAFGPLFQICSVVRKPWLDPH